MSKNVKRRRPRRPIVGNFSDRRLGFIGRPSRVGLLVGIYFGGTVMAPGYLDGWVRS